MSVKVSWAHTGYGGTIDRLVGGRMPLQEKALLVVAAVIGTPLMWFSSSSVGLISRFILTLLAAVDSIGLVYLQTGNAKRKYHSETSAKMAPKFVLRTMVEAAVQLVLFDFLAVPGSSSITLILTPFVVLGVAALWIVDLPQQRPLSTLLFFAGCVLFMLVSSPAVPNKLQWFAPLVMLKYLSSMMVRAEPYVVC